MVRKIDFTGITPQANQTRQQAEPMAAATDKGAYRSVGIGLREQELAEVETLAQANNATRNAILRLAVIRLLDEVRAGDVNIADYLVPPAQQRHRLKTDL